jgi:Domain of unknown function (DUF222)
VVSEAVLAKLAASGMCNPEEKTRVLDQAPGAEVIQRDTRTPAQRNHGGLNAGC